MDEFSNEILHKLFTFLTPIELYFCQQVSTWWRSVVLLFKHPHAPRRPKWHHLLTSPCPWARDQTHYFAWLMDIVMNPQKWVDCGVGFNPLQAPDSKQFLAQAIALDNANYFAWLDFLGSEAVRDLQDNIFPAIKNPSHWAYNRRSLLQFPGTGSRGYPFMSGLYPIQFNMGENFWHNPRRDIPIPEVALPFRTAIDPPRGPSMEEVD
jgi:hypothetical protein